jgi:hypothetical protein
VVRSVIDANVLVADHNGRVIALLPRVARVSVETVRVVALLMQGPR